MLMMRFPNKFLSVVLLSLVCVSARLSLAVEEPMPVDPAMLYESHSFDFTDGEAMATLPYRLMRPNSIEAGKHYPLVVFLHGAGERGSDNLAQLKYFPTWMASAEAREEYPCFVLAPQCRSDKWWANFRRDPAEADPLSEPPAADLGAVATVIEQMLADLPIDHNRVYLTGLSMGGFGSWDLAARTPERFAAMIPICGGGNPLLAKRYVGLPIWCFHGGEDAVVRPELSRRMVEAIREAGGELTYTEYEGVGHDSWTPAYQDPATLAWLFKQVREAHEERTPRAAE
jgi:predicted peptidase